MNWMFYIWCRKVEFQLRNGRELNKIYSFIVLSLLFYKVDFQIELLRHIKRVKKDEQKMKKCFCDDKNQSKKYG